MGKGRQYHRRRLRTVTYGVWGPTTGRATLAAAVAQHAGSRELARLQGSRSPDRTSLGIGPPSPASMSRRILPRRTSFTFTRSPALDVLQ